MDSLRNLMRVAPLTMAILSMAAGCPTVDECPGDPNKTAQGVCGCGTPDDDVDGDGFPSCGPEPGGRVVPGVTDNCPDVFNRNQDDLDDDGRGDACDNCPDVSNPDQNDFDDDDKGDACDACTDTDGDGFGDPGFPDPECDDDNCPYTPNSDQADRDGDGVGDACAGDLDADGVGDATDNCQNTANADQSDADGDGKGDVCDPCTDTDADGFGDPGFPNPGCDDDNCPDIANADQADTDGDDAGDGCDPCTDTDGDGIGDPGFPNPECPDDDCPYVANPDQAETPGDADPCRVTIDHPDCICCVDLRDCGEPLLRLDKTPIRLSQRPPRPDQTVEQFHELIDEAYRDAVAAYGNAGIDLEIVEGEADVTVILCTLGEDDCSGEFTALLDTDSGPLALADYPYPYPYHNDLLLQRLNVGRLTEILTHLPSDSERRNLLYWIALHETGHSLGLRHAETESEVMPFEIDLRRLNDRVSLSVTDLAGLQRRYGDMAEPVQIPSDFQGGLVPSPDDPDDPDHDGLPTLFELTVTRTDPDLADTDADRYDDGTEYVNGLDPRNPDTDGDGKWDRDEVEDGTDPWSPMEVIEQGNVRFPVGVATCTIPGANGSARTLALSERDLTHGTLNEGDCVVTYLETGERTAVKGAIVRALTPNERSTCLLGFSEPLQQALDPHNDFGISTGRTLVPLRFDRNLPANPILGPNASIEVIQPGREACIGEETTVLVRVKDVAGGGLSAIP